VIASGRLTLETASSDKALIANPNATYTPGLARASRCEVGAQ
jgi:hypothetical protein